MNSRKWMLTIWPMSLRQRSRFTYVDPIAPAWRTHRSLLRDRVQNLNKSRREWGVSSELRRILMRRRESRLIVRKLAMIFLLEPSIDQ